MKRILIIVLLSYSVFIVLGQEGFDILQQKMEYQSADIPEDQVFIHTDRNLYHPGDTIYFQTYIRDRFTQLAGTHSKSSYVLLINSNKEIIDSARYRISSFLSPGYLRVPDTLSSGYYKLLSFTSLMQNYNPAYAYSSWIKIDNLIPDAVTADFLFDKSAYNSGDTAEVTIKLSDNIGEVFKNESFMYSVIHNGKAISYYNAKTNKRGESLIRIRVPDSLLYTEVSLEINLRDKNFLHRQSLPREQKNIDLRFLPEGGTYTCGYKQRLAFNAVDHKGKQLMIRGVVINDLGEVVDSLRSGIYGPGLIDFIPREGRFYYAELDDYPGLSFNLPEPSVSGPVLRVVTEGTSLMVEYHNNDEDNTDYKLVLLKNSEILSVSSLAGLSSKVIFYKINDLPMGSVSFILFDRDLNPVAERLIHVNPQKKVNAEIRSLYEFYVTGQEAELEITLNDTKGQPVRGIMSVSVVDSATAIYSDLPVCNIEDEFLFDRQFYNNLPSYIRSAGLSKLIPEDLDILLMTYGWKRFIWKERRIADKSPEMNYYDNLRVKILDRMTKRKIKKLGKEADNFFLVSVEDPKIFNLNKSADGYYYFPFDSLEPNTSSIFVVPGESSVKHIKSIQVDFPHNSNYLNMILEENSSPRLSSNEHISLSHDFEINIDGVRIIEEITVRASRKPAEKYINQHEKTYRLAPTRTLSENDLRMSYSLENLLYKLFPSRLDINEKKIYFRSGPALFVLDGMPLDTNYDMLSSLSPDIIHSVIAIKGVQGFYIYGQKAMGGVVFIDTKMYHFGDEYEYEDYEYKPDKGDIGKLKSIFRPVAEFYTPTLQEMSDNPENWLRHTLYWNYNIIYDGINPVKIKYPNHKKRGSVKVIINGITENNRPVSGTLTYKIK